MRSGIPHTPRKQVLVKVNTLVDEGIATLVEAVSACEEIRTFASCQGRENLYGCAKLLCEQPPCHSQS